jgi:hypothetical protein
MIKNLPLTILLSFLFFSIKLFSQDSWYQPFIGNADGMNIQLQLQKNNNRFWGSISILDSKKSDRTDLYFFLEGHSDDDGNLKLTKTGEENVFLEGKISADEISGTIYYPVSGTAFVLYKSEMNLFQPFDLVIRNADIQLFPDNPSSPSALIEYALLFPKANTSNQFKMAIADFYGMQKDTDQFDPSKVIAAEILTFFNQYKELANISGEMNPSFQWVKSVQSGVIFNNNILVCLHRTTYVYTGGAHGMKHDSFGLFEAGSGKKILISDLFVEGYQKEISNILTAKLRLQNGLADDEFLSSNGYFVDVIEPNDNFFISPAGLGFHFNSYEIAPYSTGHTMLFLSFSEISELLKPEIKAILGL